MGAPVKLMVAGESLFICCNSCKENALKNSDATLAKVKELRGANQE